MTRLQVATKMISQKLNITKAYFEEHSSSVSFFHYHERATTVKMTVKDGS